MKRWGMTLRWVLVVMGCWLAVSCTGSEQAAEPAAARPTSTPTVAPIATPTVVPTAAPTATPTVVPTAAPTATPTLEPVGAAEIAEIPRAPSPEPGELIIVPDGPYAEGDEVTVFANASQIDDIYNIAVALCASVDGGAETCDPLWLAGRRTGSQSGAVSATVTLPRRHFGPAGFSDCAAENVACHIVMPNSSRTLERTRPLQYTSGPLEPSPTFRVEAIAPGTFELSTDFDMDEAASFLPADALDFVPAGSFDSDRLSLELTIASVCSFEAGDPPIGSELLEEWPDWWGVLDGWGLGLGSNCDWSAITGDVIAGIETGPVEVEILRSIYGYRGWSDCVGTQCFLSLDVRYLYEMDDGSLGGADVSVARALLPRSPDWPQTELPSIEILTPAPYEHGQAVRIRANNPRAPDGSGFAITRCIGNSQCVYQAQASRNADGSQTWSIPNAGCVPNRCYFALNSYGEGLPPPAVAVIPLDE